MLTESNKPSNAFRKCIYITKVKDENNEIKFNLLSGGFPLIEGLWGLPHTQNPH